MLYDRETQSEWLQLTGIAVEGRLAGKRLRLYPVAYDLWGAWKSHHPDGLVLAIPEEYAQRFGSYDDRPYGGYDDTSQLWFHVSTLDRRLPRKARVVGIEAGGAYKAYPEESVWKSGLIDDRIGVTHVSVLADRRTSRIGAFASIHRFRLTAGIVNDEGGREWQWSGDTLREANTTIVSLPIVQTFWFAWFAMHPKTELGKAS